MDKEENIHIAWLGMDSLHNNKVKYSNNKNGFWKPILWTIIFFGDNYYAVPSLSISPSGRANILYLSVIDGINRNVHAGKW
ncbi:MAG: hypothetical protein IPL53_13425 [Ignavibacteria bacterium]|nr:hypothetical protein [Ignavibacteria bacterium]